MMIGFSAYGIVTAYNFFEKKSKGNKIAGLIFYPNLINAAKEKSVPTAEESAEEIKSDGRPEENEISVSEQTEENLNTNE